MHIHVCAHPAASVSQMCTLMSNKHLDIVYTCTCTGAQNTCSKVHATLTAKKSTYIHAYTHMDTHIYAHEHACASMTLPNTPTHRYWDSQSMHKYVYTYIYTRTYMHTYTYIYTHAYICVYTCFYTYIHTHIYTHTYKMNICTHARTPGTTARQRLCEKTDLTPWSSALLPVRCNPEGGHPPWPAAQLPRSRGTTNKRRTTTATHHTITTARHRDYNRWFALVRSRSTQFMARSSCEARRRCSEIGFTFLLFPRRFIYVV